MVRIITTMALIIAGKLVGNASQGRITLTINEDKISCSIPCTQAFYKVSQLTSLEEKKYYLK